MLYLSLPRLAARSASGFSAQRWKHWAELTLSPLRGLQTTPASRLVSQYLGSREKSRREGSDAFDLLLHPQFHLPLQTQDYLSGSELAWENQSVSQRRPSVMFLVKSKRSLPGTAFRLCAVGAGDYCAGGGLYELHVAL